MTQTPPALAASEATPKSIDPVSPHDAPPVPDVNRALIGAASGHPPPKDSDIPRFSSSILNVGFCTALVLAVASLTMGSYYLYDFLESTKSGVIEFIREHSSKPGQEDLLYLAINARLVMARLALVSCGMFIGMAFGFLGFALFLIGVRGEMDVDASRGNADEGFHVKLARMSPGIFVILCSTILIGVCVTRRTDLEYDRSRPTSVMSGPQSAPTSANLDDEQRDAIVKAVNAAQGGQKKVKP